MTVTVECNGPVTTIVHARPEVRNAMDPASANALVEAFRQFDRDPDQSVAVLWGAGGAFCAGADLKFVASSSHRPVSPKRKHQSVPQLC